MPEGIKVNMPKNWQPLVDEKKRDEAVKNATLKYWTLSKKHDVTAIRRLFNACPEVFLNERFVKDLIDTYLDFTTFKHNHAGTQIANMQELVAEMRRLIEEKYGIKRDKFGNIINEDTRQLIVKSQKHAIAEEKGAMVEKKADDWYSKGKSFADIFDDNGFLDDRLDDKEPTNNSTSKRDDGAAHGGSGGNKNHHRQGDFDVDKERGAHKRYPDFDRSR